MSDEEKPKLPKWWTDGTGPLALGAASSVAAAVVALLYFRAPPPDGFGTLILISILADIAAFDNATDLQGRRDPFKSRAAIAAAVVAVLSGLVAYGALGRA